MVLNPDSEFKKYRKRASFKKIFFSRLALFIVAIIIQIVIMFYIINYIIVNTVTTYAILLLYDVIAIFAVVNSTRLKDSYKIIWLILLHFMPVFGFFLFATIAINNKLTSVKGKLEVIMHRTQTKYYKNTCTNELLDVLSKNEFVPTELILYKYLTQVVKFFPYKNTKLTYFDNGKEAFEDMLDKMKNAKKFIFIEVFILEDGILWREMLEILKERANAGVEIRLMYDGINTISSFGKDYCDELKKYGIKAKMFMPPHPIVSNEQNNRNHKKIMIIDNEIAYTGSINIGDEYVNLYERLGYWKDAAIRIEGNAVEGLTIINQELWILDEPTRDVDINEYLPMYSKKIVDNENEMKYVIPWTDIPSFDENVAREVISFMIRNAQEYMYIMTPYLVLDEPFVHILEEAAKRGVDIRIIVPHVQDKKYVFWVNRTYYKLLRNAGVRVYEFADGFVHSKVYLQDGIRGIVGTTNLDYRSLFLHYENGIYIYRDEVLKDIKKDFMETFDRCIEMTQVEIDNIPLRHKVLGRVLKFFAPMM